MVCVGADSEKAMRRLSIFSEKNDANESDVVINEEGRVVVYCLLLSRDGGMLRIR